MGGGGGRVGRGGVGRGGVVERLPSKQYVVGSNPI